MSHRRVSAVASLISGGYGGQHYPNKKSILNQPHSFLITLIPIHSMINPTDTITIENIKKIIANWPASEVLIFFTNIPNRNKETVINQIGTTNHFIIT
jgi:hypothetical protein